MGGVVSDESDPLVLASEIRHIRTDIAELRTFVRDTIAPLAGDVKANTSWRDRIGGALKLAVVLLGVVGGGGALWLTYITVTTIRTEAAIEQIRGAQHAGKAPRRLTAQDE